jgi:cyclophilin family peptidyl-prolyl cis-trans isomerase
VAFHRVVPDFMVQFGCPLARAEATWGDAGSGNAPPNSEFRELLSGDLLRRDAKARPRGRGGAFIGNLRRQERRCLENCKRLHPPRLPPRMQGCIPDEHLCRDSNARLTVSMANTGVLNSGSSQIFINVAENPGAPPVILRL